MTLPNQPNKLDRHDICGLILAGGTSRRFNGIDKGTVHINGKPMIELVVSALKNQLDEIIISANTNQNFYGHYTDKVIRDVPASLGPLSGIYAASTACTHEYCLVTTCDMPLLPNTLVDQLNANDSDLLVTVKVNHKLQPVFLMHTSLRESIYQQMRNNNYRLTDWLDAHSSRTVDFSDQAECFVNINSPQDIASYFPEH